MPHLRFVLGLSLGLAFLHGTAASALTVDWVTVGDPGNACDSQSQGCFGAVATNYRISKYEITNTEYAEFLNAVAATDANGLYNTGMGGASGGITRSGSPGSYTYAATAGRRFLELHAEIAQVHDDQLCNVAMIFNQQDAALHSHFVRTIAIGG